MAPTKRSPAEIVHAAEENGWTMDGHLEEDKVVGRYIYVLPEVKAQHDSLLSLYAVWCWNRLGTQFDDEAVKEEVLRRGAGAPSIEHLEEAVKISVPDAQQAISSGKRAQKRREEKKGRGKEDEASKSK